MADFLNQASGWLNGWLNAVTSADELSVPRMRITHGEGVSLLVEWFPVMGAMSYTMILSEDAPSQVTKEVLYIDDHTSVVLQDLKPATRYCVIMSAKNSNNQSAYSKPVCVTTGVPK